MSSVLFKIYASVRDRTSLILNGSEDVKSMNFVALQKNNKKNSKNIKFDNQGDFDMKIIFNDLDRPFKF
jgi:hypothetical protein